MGAVSFPTSAVLEFPEHRAQEPVSAASADEPDEATDHASLAGSTADSHRG